MVRGTGVSLYAFGRLATAIVAWIALGTCLVFAQISTATMSGVVRDGTGGVIPGVTVTIKHTDTGLTRTVNTTENGGYRMPSLPVGAYEVTAEKLGFKQQVRRGVNLVVGQEAVIDLTLEVGAVAEQVTVTEEAPLVNTTPSSTSGLITEQQIKELPLNGRSFDQLLMMNVGMVNNSSNVQNNAWTSFSVAGKRPETNRFVINGIDYIGGTAAGLYITPSGAGGQLLGVDAVREYNVLADTYGAEYGKRAGGQISIVTTSGTNQLQAMYAAIRQRLLARAQPGAVPRQRPANRSGALLRQCSTSGSGELWSAPLRLHRVQQRFPFGQLHHRPWAKGSFPSGPEFCLDR